MVNENFRQALRRLRSDREQSQADLGRAIGYTGAYISDLELGRKPPHPDLARRLDRALGAGGRLITLAQCGIAEPLDGDWTPQAARDVLAGVTESALMDRRDFLVLTGAGVAGLAHAWNGATLEPLAATGGGWVTPEAVDRLERRIEELWHLDDLIGGGACLDAGVSDLRLTNRLMRQGRYEQTVGVRLFSLAAALARFCGFAAFDSGMDAAAQRFWHAGLRVAAAAGDVDQGVYILSNLALQAIYAGDGATAVQMLDVAKRRVDPAARTVLAMLECWAVRAHAVAGEHHQAAAALNRADDLWEQRHMEDDPGWVYWMPQPSLTAEAGTALLEAGDFAAAERSLLAGMDTLDAESARERNLYLVRLAEVRLHTGRLDEAVVTARSAIDAAEGIDSVRVRRTMDRLMAQMPATEPQVIELRERRAA